MKTWKNVSLLSYFERGKRANTEIIIKTQVCVSPLIRKTSTSGQRPLPIFLMMTGDVVSVIVRAKYHKV